MSDKEIWNNLRSGDQKALEQIYRSYFSTLYTYGKRFTKDENTVEDCIQELFVELWNRRTKLSETNAIKPYLLISLKRKIFHTVKKLRKSTDTELEEKYFDIELSIDEILIAKETTTEQKNNLTSAFNELSDRQKEILYLKYYSEMDYNEISRIMDLNYQSARNLVSRALQKLSKHMMIFFLILFKSYPFVQVSE
ncbi:MAG: sigma-70 family RNA polymerase sigma factor [Saprospiraceae bacterium]|nr:sigma-70 family RNA polymerase sigma factor [Saprospiraceae bacterium]